MALDQKREGVFAVVAVEIGVERQLGAVDVAGEVGVRRLDPPAGDERDDGCKVFVQQPRAGL